MLLLASWWLIFLPNCKLSDLSPRNHADLVTCSWDLSSPYNNFAMCIRSLSDMAIKLDELSIVGGQNGIAYRIFLPASRRDNDHLFNVFADLRKIYLNISPHGVNCHLGSKSLGRFITHAQMLHSLDLNCVQERPYPDTRIIILKVIRDFTWPHLKHFGLSGFIVCSDAGLMSLFKRHRATLESVSLKSIHLRPKINDPTDSPPGQTWKHFFGELRHRSISFRSLTLVDLCDRSNRQGKWPYLTDRANAGTRVLQYLRDGGQNPFNLHVTILKPGMAIVSSDEGTENSDVETENSDIET